MGIIVQLGFHSRTTPYLPGQPTLFFTQAPTPYFITVNVSFYFGQLNSIQRIRIVTWNSFMAIQLIMMFIYPSSMLRHHHQCLQNAKQIEWNDEFFFFASSFKFSRVHIAMNFLEIRIPFLLVLFNFYMKNTYKCRIMFWKLLFYITMTFNFYTLPYHHEI